MARASSDSGLKKGALPVPTVCKPQLTQTTSTTRSGDSDAAEPAASMSTNLVVTAYKFDRWNQMETTHSNNFNAVLGFCVTVELQMRLVESGFLRTWPGFSLWRLNP